MAQIYKVFLNEKSLLITDDNNISDGVIIDSINIGDIQSQLNNIASSKFSKFVLIVSDASKCFDIFCNSLKIIKAAGGIVQNVEGKLLMIFRRGKWDLPKGKMETGETKEQTAVREVEEETGARNLVLKNYHSSTYHVYILNGEWVLKESTWFTMTCNDTRNCTPQEEEFISEVRWVDKNELRTIIPHAFSSLKDLLEAYLDS